MYQTIKTKLVLLLIVGSVLIGYSQSLNEKYWYYRDRQQKNFIKIGEPTTNYVNNCVQGANLAEYKLNAQGYSLPATGREFGNDLNNMEFGDGTSHWGWYVGILATEYAVLKNSGQPTDNVLKELYYALKAFDRLDKSSERFFDPSSKPQFAGQCLQNGFLLRSDLGNNFIIANFKDGSGNTVSAVSPTDRDNLHTMTADQYAFMMVGFALVKKSIGSSVSYNGMNFHSTVIDYTKRLINYVVSDPAWLYRYPDLSIVNNTNQESFPTMAYPLYKAAGYIVGYQDPSYLAWSFNPNVASMGISSQTLWQLLQIPGLNSLSENKNITSFIQALAAVGNSWGCQVQESSNTINVCIIPSPWGCVYSVPVTYWIYTPPQCALTLNLPLPPLVSPIRLPQFPINTTSLVFKEYTRYIKNKYNTPWGSDFYSLLYEYLHDVNPSQGISSQNFLNLLQSAPCGGPEYYSSQSYDRTNPKYANLSFGTEGFRTYNIWEHFDDAKNGGGFQGKFIGQDVMITNNVYKLTRDKSSITNQMDCSFSGGTISTNQNCFNSVVGNNVVVASGVRVKSGGSVSLSGVTTLQSGASILAGHKFVPDCANNQYLRKESTTDTSYMSTAVATSQTTPNYSVSSTKKQNYIPLDEYIAKYTPTKKVENKTNTGESIIFSVKLYPNPVSNGLLTLDVFSLKEDIAEVQIIDITGRNVGLNKQFNLASGTSDIQIDIEELSNGRYTMSIITSQSKTIKDFVVLK